MTYPLVYPFIVRGEVDQPKLNLSPRPVKTGEWFGKDWIVLDGLKPAIRKAFLWHQLEGLGYAEIGQRLGVCQRSVKRYMAQAYEHCLLAELR